MFAKSGVPSSRCARQPPRRGFGGVSRIVGVAQVVRISQTVVGAAASAQVPRATPHLRESVRCSGIPPLQLSRFMGHAKVTTTLAIYTHLFDDDHVETMAALEAMSRPTDAPNVTPLRRWA